MTFEISSTLLHFLIKDLEVLRGAKVEKIYQLEKDTFLFRFHSSDGKKILRFTMPALISFTEQEYSAPMNPPGFCVFLRKYLTNARVVSVEQKDFERILIITFSTKHGELLLIAELFKPSNLILCKKEEDSLMVINALQRQRFKDREVWAKKPYVFPPSLTNPLTLSSDGLLEIINNSDRMLVKALASKLGLGGVFAEKIISLTSINKEAQKISQAESVELIGAIKKFFSEEYYPVVHQNKISLLSIKEKPESSLSISQAIDSLSPLQREEVKSKTISKKKEKTSSLVEIQEKMIKNLEKKAKENQEKGEFIYSNYQEFKNLLDLANKIRFDKGLDKLEEEMKKNPKFISLNKKEKEIKLKF